MPGSPVGGGWLSAGSSPPKPSSAAPVSSAVSEEGPPVLAIDGISDPEASDDCGAGPPPADVGSATGCPQRSVPAEFVSADDDPSVAADWTNGPAVGGGDADGDGDPELLGEGSEPVAGVVGRSADLSLGGRRGARFGGCSFAGAPVFVGVAACGAGMAGGAVNFGCSTASASIKSDSISASTCVAPPISIGNALRKARASAHFAS